ncbi:lytic transglycosylase domain-containing protein [Nocardioides sp. WS12]|uniref:lytic transglycosylase domain-containing protein n=1 Tax=Nocardioides sp. WS12 TaxID=2486272 RepID=UPI0015FAA9DA|nr:lytic transglycosylase domain-containing protein [Nocardioides sp. WS12]
MNALHRQAPSHPWVRRGAALLPLVLVSATWTANVSGVGGPSAGTSVSKHNVSRAPVQVPDVEVEPAASVARPIASGGRGPGVVRTAAAVQIPAAALAAYQRAATVIASADENCHLAWPLLAAIGRVESDHGRAGGSVLDDEGVARPAIVGIRLDGRRGTSLISDTDGGRYDGDRSFDRAVGPLQFIPTTWGVVGVDADGDGARNPQDIDDAALAAGVHLCSGTGHLGRMADQRRALLRYNHSGAYVRLVLSTVRSYEASADSSVAGYLVAQGSSLRGHRNERSNPTRTRATAVLEQPSPGRDDRPAESSGSRPEPVDPTPKPAPTAPSNDLVTRVGKVLECAVQGLVSLLQRTSAGNCVAGVLTP